MNIGLVIYGSLAAISGGYLFDRMLVEKLRGRGDSVEIISMPRRGYARSLLENLRDWSSPGLDLVLQDELNHPSLFVANRRAHDAPILTIVHHLRSSERRPASENAIYRWVERLYLATVDGFIFNSDQTRISVERLIGKASRSVVATPGGDRLGQTGAERVRARAAEPGPLRILFVGNLIPAKGLDVLLEAMAQLPRDKVHLEVIGSEDAAPVYAARMRRTARDGGLPVTFSGALDELGLATRLRNAHVLALPSYYEGFGIAFLEGMAHGLPALGARAGAVPDMVTSGENGFLVEPGDFRRLARHLAAMAHDRALLAKLGEGSLRRFAEYPTWDQTTERIRDFLLEVAAAPVAEASRHEKKHYRAHGAEK